MMISMEDLMRSIPDNVSDSLNRSAGYLDLPENQLYALLGAEVQGQGLIRPRMMPGNADDILRGPPGSELGRRIFKSWSRALHGFLCTPDKEARDIQQQMLGAILSKSGGGAALIAAGLVSVFALSPTTAALVAALIVKLVVAPAGEEVCTVWGESLKAGG